MSATYMGATEAWHTAVAYAQYAYKTDQANGTVIDEHDGPELRYYVAGNAIGNTHPYFMARSAADVRQSFRHWDLGTLYYVSPAGLCAEM